MPSQEISPKAHHLFIRAMEERHLSVAELGRRTGIPDKSITRYRQGQSIPRDYFGAPSANAVKIARELGMDVDELFPLPRRQSAAA